MLAPINFELLYAQQKEQQQKQASDTPEAEQIN
jgi:preprotein translocase subunit SecB